MATKNPDPRRREIHHQHDRLLAALAASERGTNHLATDLAYQLATKTLADLTDAIRRLRGNNPTEPHDHVLGELCPECDGWAPGQPTDEAAALRSAPVANDNPCHACNSCTNPARCVISR